MFYCLLKNLPPVRLLSPFGTPELQLPPPCRWLPRFAAGDSWISAGAPSAALAAVPATQNWHRPRRSTPSPAWQNGKGWKNYGKTMEKRREQKQKTFQQLKVPVMIQRWVMEEHWKWLTLAVANLPATLCCRRSWAKDPKATWPATLRSSDLSTTSCTATIWDVYCRPSPPCTWPGKCLENFQAKTTTKVGQLR